MAFISIPIIFAEDDFEKKETLGLKIKNEVFPITINTKMIVAYNEMDNGNTLVRMANGDAYESTIDIDTFEDVLSAVENIIDIKAISKN
jgi:hypothetical protein